jgi:hypothetical protein
VRSLSLLRVALEAERLRLRHHVKRTVTRAVLGCIALGFLFLALVFGHIAVWFWLAEFMKPRAVALIFGGFDLFLAIVLAFIALRSSPGRVELEALAVRRRALDDAAASLTISAMMIRLVEQIVRARR